MEKILNYTPHDVVLYNEDATEVIETFPSVGTIRLASTTEPAGEFDGIPLTKTVYGKPEGPLSARRTFVSSFRRWSRTPVQAEEISLFQVNR